MSLEIVSIAERPDLASSLDNFPDCWPEYMAHQRLSHLFYDHIAPAHPAFCLVAVDQANSDRLLAKAYAVPLSWPAGPDWTPPADGHDAVILQAAADLFDRRPATIAAAIEITVQTHARRRGLSALMLEALRQRVAARGLPVLLAPVRPTEASSHGDVAMSDYAWRTRDDGLPVDPWLRVHARAGGRLVAVAPSSMTVTGTIAEWRSWTGLPFDRPGPVAVPDTLVAVQADLTHDRAVYVEPNIWVRHTLGRS
ncbi:hypothetical protein DFJ67_0537 [Asanoa ferruginea]|uniref:N-acetyltransferase n=1 Tax=Asanoa ferruginea TaxID=53367 RepID=A0A3D9ZB18_9ACTN|nr:N-acetyltransferase [Asanoa ferruginea]REF94598.1 hypothetical protein DFJ67_0537 [Asanoa ferruginea]GIF50785.1 hypothetical protein Afe04nite_53240 [Asanoa ferruginea]